MCFVVVVVVLFVGLVVGLFVCFCGNQGSSSTDSSLLWKNLLMRKGGCCGFALLLLCPTDDFCKCRLPGDEQVSSGSPEASMCSPLKLTSPTLLRQAQHFNSRKSDQAEHFVQCNTSCTELFCLRRRMNELPSSLCHQPSVLLTHKFVD